MGTSKIRKGDTVEVLAGKSKGATGEVLRIDPEKERAVVSGVNMLKKHQKPNPQANQPGGIIDKEGPIHLSNLAVVDPSLKKGKKYSKVGIKVLEDGRKVRYFKPNNELVDVG